MKLNNQIEEIIRLALKEDIGDADITTEASVNKRLKASAKFLVKQEGVIAGLRIVETIINIFDPKLNLEILIPDGSKVKYGDVAAILNGKASSILSVERTALNFLQRMSGVATVARQFADKVKHTKAKIVDTRKTAPGHRLLDKLAVKIAGCDNHRIGLFDMFLIKDNHIEAAGSITRAVNSCKRYRKKSSTDLKIEVEASNIKQVKEALSCNVDIIMLDNFSIDKMAEAVKIVNGKCLLEASGGVNIDNVKEIAETGVDLISVGALTHSVKALDISLKIERLKI